VLLAAVSGRIHPPGQLSLVNHLLAAQHGTAHSGTAHHALNTSLITPHASAPSSRLHNHTTRVHLPQFAAKYTARRLLQPTSTPHQEACCAADGSEQSALCNAGG
jgi:hypothetical protein